MFTYFYNKFRPVNCMHYIKCGVNIVETFSLPTDAHNVKKHRVIKTF